MTEPCSHHEALVGITLYDLGGEQADASCAWCGDEDVTIGLVKNKRHEIAFCDECRDVIRSLARDTSEER